MEASGTSGMKAAMNGVLNLSILDGWWPEGCEHGVTGWAIGDEQRRRPIRTRATSRALYDTLEGEVLPAFADPARWTRDDARLDPDGRWSASPRTAWCSEYFARLYAPTSPAR